MSMPTLDLPREALTKPTRLDVANVAHLMLWPNDPTMRARAMRVWLIEEGKRLVREQALSTDQILDLIENAQTVEPRQTLHEEQFFAEGLAVGAILFRAIAHREVQDDHGSIGKSIEVLTTAFWRKRRLQGKTFNNKVIPRLRCVSHLWAVFVADRLSGQTAFPCRQGDLPIFLSRAEKYRQRGESLRPPHSPRLFLMPGDTVVIPHTELLPEVNDLEFTLASDFSRTA